jgi:replication factor A1
MMGGGGGGSSHAFQPIASLNPYNNRWTIKARWVLLHARLPCSSTRRPACCSITSKSDIKTWNKPTGSGKLFSIDLLDEEGTEIRATFFKEAVDKWEPMLQPNGVYYFSGGKMKLANKNFTSVKNDYEITFDDKSVIEPAHGELSISANVFVAVVVTAVHLQRTPRSQRSTSISPRLQTWR